MSLRGPFLIPQTSCGVLARIELIEAPRIADVRELPPERGFPHRVTRTLPSFQGDSGCPCARSTVHTASQRPSLPLPRSASGCSSRPPPSRRRRPFLAGLSVSQPNTSTPILGWTLVEGATKYEVQVNNDPGFASPELSLNNDQPAHRPHHRAPAGPGLLHVRAVNDQNEKSDWSLDQFTVVGSPSPTPLSPVDGSLSAPAFEPAAAELVGAAKGPRPTPSRSTATPTSSEPRATRPRRPPSSCPDPLGAGDYWWRVTATKGSGIVSEPSDASSFLIAALPAPLLVSPSEQRQPSRSKTWSSTGRPCRSQDLRRPGGPRRGLQQPFPGRRGHPGHALLAAGDAEQRPVLLASARRRPRGPANGLDRHLQLRFPAALAGQAAGSLPVGSIGRRRRSRPPTRTTSGPRSSTPPTTSCTPPPTRTSPSAWTRAR